MIGAPRVPSRRERQAAETQRLILASARRRFAEDGYAATSLKTIAADVGVSVQTIYDSVGAKAELVRRLNDLIDDEAGVGEQARKLPEATDPHEVLRVPARITRGVHERCGDLVRATFDAARAEPELAGVGEEGSRRHRTGALQVATRLAELGALRTGVEVAGAALTIAALTDVRLAFVLHDEHGLGHDAIEDWMVARAAEAVLGG